jgi:hypothetical protein
MEILEDIPLMRRHNGLCFYGLFDSRTGTGSVAVSREAYSAIPSDVEFSESSFRGVISRIMDVYRREQFLDFVFTMTGAAGLWIASIGGMEAVLVPHSSQRLTFLTAGRHHFRTSADAQARVGGEELVYGMEISPEIRKVVVRDDDRFLVVLSAAAAAAFTETGFTALCAAARSARDLAHALKAHAAVGARENVSVLVVDFGDGHRDLESSERAAAAEALKEQSTSSGREEESGTEELAPPVVRARRMEAHVITRTRSSDSFSDHPPVPPYVADWDELDAQASSQAGEEPDQFAVQFSSDKGDVSSGEVEDAA